MLDLLLTNLAVLYNTEKIIYGNYTSACVTEYPEDSVAKNNSNIMQGF